MLPFAMTEERRIFVLPPDLASQIAAGEVVERPASAVKELVENALDAGATRIDTEIEGGGIPFLCVSDDGSGMSEDDALLSLERHATSKLRTLAELARIGSYGFRGEALPSIASVSRLSLATRSRANDAGALVLVEGGRPPALRPNGMSVGTRVEVRDLFFNVPARRKFMRSTGTESGHITEVIEAAALTHPEVTFTLKRDGRSVREFLRVQSRPERVAQVSAGDELTRCAGERGPLRIDAFVSRPEHARAGAGGLRLFVNSRPVRDRAIFVTIAQAYGSVLERGRYPRGVVYLDLPAEFLDVNVHPQKAEVRFADPRALNDALYGVLSRALASAFSLPAPNRSAWARPAAATSKVIQETQPTSVRQEAERAHAPAPQGYPEPATAVPFAAETSPAFVAVRDAISAPIHPRAELKWASLRFVAQLRQMYLLCEADDGIYLLDQHAAAERVTFTRLRRAYQSRAVPSQSLLFPLMVDVLPAEAELIETRAKEIAEVGLDVRVRGSDSVSIHAIPRLLQRASPERLLRDLLAEASRGGGRGFSDAVDLALATMACHGSIRAGDAVSPDEVKALLAALDDADFAGHCPHGRPVVTFLSFAELDRKVGRR
jgi:DNA mismatch repair protein MutL